MKRFIWSTPSSTCTIVFGIASPQTLALEGWSPLDRDSRLPLCSSKHIRQIRSRFRVSVLLFLLPPLLSWSYFDLISTLSSAQTFCPCVKVGGFHRFFYPRISRFFIFSSSFMVFASINGSLRTVGWCLFFAGCGFFVSPGERWSAKREPLPFLIALLDGRLMFQNKLFFCWIPLLGWFYVL